MRRHVATAHEKRFPYKCQCGVGFQGKEEFNRHKAKHNGIDFALLPRGVIPSDVQFGYCCI